ncbi:MAG TPA: glycosyltransferase family 4 protein [Candidatus Binatia bacterium]|nr:glycosyltransferase family 4 protein [Candidatus Binatia bacterium]
MKRDKRPLRILHVDPERGWGGGERQVAGLVDYLAGRGHVNHLLCYPGGPLGRETAAGAAKLHPLTMRNDVDFTAVPAVRRLLRRENYDIVHFHTKRAHALSAWLGSAPTAQKRLVTRRMDYPIRRGWVDRYLYNRCVDGVVAISRPIADLLVEGGVAREKIRMIPSGVDPVPYANIPPPDGRRVPVVVGTVAVLEERKGIRFLLEAAAELKRRGKSLVYRIAGDGSQKNRLREMTRDLGLQADVEFAGFVTDVPAFMRTIDVFVLPSLYEGLGVAALEAMAAARPVVASAVGGLKDSVVDGETGLLVPPASAAALADAIGAIATEAERMRTMGESGRARLREHFTMERMARANEDFYYDLLGADDRG